MQKQLTIFDFDFSKEETYLEKFKIRKPVRLIELFAGIGAQAMGLKKAGINFEHYKVVEFDKYPLTSYNAIHGTNFPVLDITKIKGEDLEIIDTDKYCYIMTYSFPCQDLSLAGKQAGMTKDSGTRSGLLWEVERLLIECENLPQVLLLENVPQIHNKKNMADFQLWIDRLSELGYDSFWEDLNSKDYGIPQNRNRTFMISILKEKNGSSYYYEFPKKQPLNLRLRDILEDEVDEKYYLSEKMMKYIIADNEKWTGNNGKSLINKDIASTINTGEGSRRCDASNYICDDLPENFDLKKSGEIIVDAILVGESWERMHQALRRVYNKDGICPTLDTMQGGYRQPKIFIKEKTKKGYAEAYEGDDVYINRNDVGVVVPLKRGYSIEVKEDNPNDTDEIDIIGNYSKSNYNATNIVGKNGISPTVRENHGQVTGITTLWTETQAKMINEDGNVKRYINSNIVDEFNEGQAADISFPNGYNKGPRVHNECPALNTTTTQSSFIVKVVAAAQRGRENGQQIEISNREYANAITTVQKDSLIVKVNIPQIVRVRKFPVDTEKLVNTLREHKEICNFSNKEIAKELDLPITKVEHWFRKDNSFAIPDAEIWYELKSLLKIETDEFDKNIMTFEEREGTYEKSNRCYYEDGISPTLTSTSADEKIIINTQNVQSLRIRKLTPKECWRLMGFDDESFEKANKINSNTQLYKQAGNSIVVDVLASIFKEMK